MSRKCPKACPYHTCPPHGVLVVGLTPVAEEECGLDACAAHLHCRCIRVRNKLWCQSVALVQGQPVLCCAHLACSGCREGSKEGKKLQRLHQRKEWAQMRCEAKDNCTK